MQLRGREAGREAGGEWYLLGPQKGVLRLRAGERGELFPVVFLIRHQEIPSEYGGRVRGISSVHEALHIGVGAALPAAAAPRPGTQMLRELLATIVNKYKMIINAGENNKTTTTTHTPHTPHTSILLFENVSKTQLQY
jgi:hypothetical protein